MNSTEWTEIKLKITETAQSPKSELQIRLGPNRRHTLGTSPLELTRDSMKYMRMWHTAFFNKFNGKMMICGGTNSQNEFYKNLPPVFLLQGESPFRCIIQGLIPERLNQGIDPRKNENGTKEPIDHNTYTGKLHTKYIYY